MIIDGKSHSEKLRKKIKDENLIYMSKKDIIDLDNENHKIWRPSL